MCMGFIVWKLVKGFYIVLLLFVYLLLIIGDFEEMIWVFCFVLFGIYVIVVGFEGYFEYLLYLVVWLLMFFIGLLMFWFYGQVLLDGVGLVIFIVVFVWSSC